MSRDIKKVLKNLSKNQLIKLILELRLQVSQMHALASLYEQKLKKYEPEVEDEDATT